MVGVRRSRAEWRELVSAWRESSMSGVDFAQQEGLNPNTFAWWRSELGREEAGPVLSLVPVTVQRPNGRCVEVTLADGVRVQIPHTVNPQRAGALVARLLEP